MKKEFWIGIGLLLLMLACSLPSKMPVTAPTPSPMVYVTVLVATPTPEGELAVTPQAPESTATLSATVTVTTTATVTPTGTPTKTKQIFATATPAPPGPPLGFSDPPWSFVEWHQVPGTGDYDGTITLNVVGGTPPYRSQLEDQPIVDGVNVPIHWRLCQPMPATVRVWSADGQEVETKIWVWKVGCKE